MKEFNLLEKLPPEDEFKKEYLNNYDTVFTAEYEYCFYLGCIMLLDNKEKYLLTQETLEFQLKQLEIDYSLYKSTLENVDNHAGKGEDNRNQFFERNIEYYEKKRGWKTD